MKDVLEPDESMAQIAAKAVLPVVGIVLLVALLFFALNKFFSGTSAPPDDPLPALATPPQSSQASPQAIPGTSSEYFLATRFINHAPHPLDGELLYGGKVIERFSIASPGNVAFCFKANVWLPEYTLMLYHGLNQERKSTRYGKLRFMRLEHEPTDLSSFKVEDWATYHITPSDKHKFVVFPDTVL